MIYYFREGLKLSIKIKIEQQNQESVSFKEMLQRAINIKAKTSLKYNIIIRDLDIRWSRNHGFSKTTVSKVQTQETTIKNPFPKKLKAKETKPIHAKTVKPL